MLKTDMPNYDINGDPVPNVASDAEIEIAEQLRHQIEERYLVGISPPPPRQAI